MIGIQKHKGERERFNLMNNLDLIRNYGLYDHPSRETSSIIEGALL